MIRRHLINFASGLILAVADFALVFYEGARWADRKLKDMRPSLQRRAEQKRRPF